MLCYLWASLGKLCVCLWVFSACVCLCVNIFLLKFTVIRNDKHLHKKLCFSQVKKGVAADFVSVSHCNKKFDSSAATLELPFTCRSA